MPKVSPEHKEGVRRRIMDAAMTCLRRNNWDDITTREVLTEAGLSIGTFYNYFPSKDHLYAALAEDALTTDLAAVVSDGDPDRPLAVAGKTFAPGLHRTLPPGAARSRNLRGRMDAGPERPRRSPAERLCGGGIRSPRREGASRWLNPQ